MKMVEESSVPTLTEMFEVWLRIGFLSFGGPAAQIALMHYELVKERRWLSEQQYLHALSFCMLLPGPEAMQLATYAGWRLHGVRGGLLAGSLFVLPGALIILILAGLYSAFGSVPIFEALFVGIKAAVVAIVAQALWRMSKKTLVSIDYWLIAIASFVGIFFFSLPFPIIIVSALILGAVFSLSTANSSQAAASTDSNNPDVGLVKNDDGAKADDQFSLVASLKTCLLWLVVWWLPLLIIIFLWPDSVFADLSVFFSKLAVVTFGGAYAVLSYMAQDVVTQYGWLTAAQMIDGLGLAETTPGPLILVTEFVGFLASSKSGFWFGVLGAVVALWATFIPCFLWVFLGAPYIEWLGLQPRIKSALNAVSAAVVGVILNLSLWFFLHVLFDNVTLRTFSWFSLWQPELNSINWHVLLLLALSVYLLFVRKLGVIKLLAIAASLSTSLSFFELP
ncbi:MAG: chromate transporter [Pseudohongiellaceae bacterium]|jgi:chromate transporter